MIFTDDIADERDEKPTTIDLAIRYGTIKTLLAEQERDLKSLGIADTEAREYTAAELAGCAF